MRASFGGRRTRTIEGPQLIARWAFGPAISGQEARVFKTIGQVATYKPLSKCSLEELAAHQRTIDPSGGILFARKPDGEEKCAARQQIVDLFKPDVWDRPLMMLTMPGLHWRFEGMVLGWREPGWSRPHAPHPRRTHFTGFENDRAIYYSALTQMPGLYKKAALKPVHWEQKKKFPFAEMAFKTKCASFFFANIDDAMVHEWRYGWDAAWLDFTGPINAHRMVKIRRFYEKYVREILIVTALRARWDRETSNSIERVGGHSQWLRKKLEGNVLHDIEYMDTSPMAQFAVSKTIAAKVATSEECAA